LEISMYSTTAYLYQQRQQVLLIDTSGAYFDRRWVQLYAKKLTINKGVDNVILFEFVNQDQKPVNITGSTFKFRVINTKGVTLVYETDLVTLSATLGRAKVTITAEESAALPAEPSSWSIERSSGNLNEAVFVNGQSGGRGDVDIIDSTYPEFVPSQFLSQPDIYGPQNYFNPVISGGYPDWALNPPVGNVNINTEKYTSQVPTTGSGLTTFQLEMHNFTGNVKAQAAQDYQSGFVNVGNVFSYYNITGTRHINVEGFHPLIRLAVNQYSGQTDTSLATANATVVDGTVYSIAVTNSGGGYLAPPNVTIVGTGAGAIAESVLSGDQVIAVNVIEGGSGYIPTPANTVAAGVSLNNGFITDITYR
jgi:hypothetical protein